MRKIDDILLKTSMTGEEVKQLNFINNTTNLSFRRYYRQGLRSHIFEVLQTDDVQKETKGEVIDGIRWFPRAVPEHVLRIMRTRFDMLKQVREEIKKYTLVLKSLGPDLIAQSSEFIVEYTGAGKREIVLCGLQEYIEGTTLDPWSLYGKDPLKAICRSRFSEGVAKQWVPAAKLSISRFVQRVRKMIIEEGYIPDLAGNGNLILTKEGKVKLVDINNILKLEQYSSTLVDDKGYPACDKSMEVLVILEEKVLNNRTVHQDPLYSRFLEEERKEEVKRLEEQFFNKRRHLSAI